MSVKNSLTKLVLLLLLLHRVGYVVYDFFVLFKISVSNLKLYCYCYIRAARCVAGGGGDGGGRSKNMSFQTKNKPYCVYTLKKGHHRAWTTTTTTMENQNADLQTFGVVTPAFVVVLFFCLFFFPFPRPSAFPSDTHMKIYYLTEYCIYSLS